MSFSLDNIGGIQTIDDIPSVSSETRPPRIGTSENLKSFAETVREESLDHALNQIAEKEYAEHLTDALFKTRTESWRFLPSEYIRDRCLVVNDGFGKRSLLLSEICEEVYTVGKSKAELEILDLVAEISGKSNLQPLHGPIDQFSFPEDTFDTIVLANIDGRLNKPLDTLRNSLRPDGTLLIHLDGWPRKTGLAKLMGLDPHSDRSSQSPAAAFRSNLATYTRTIRSNRFNIRERYALLSTNRHENEWVFEIDDDAALHWVLTRLEKVAFTRAMSVIRRLAAIADRLKILEHCYPSYLLVCSTGDVTTKSCDTKLGKLLMSGKNRSIILEINREELRKVKKIPNSKRQSTLTEHEANFIQKLNSANHKLSETFPTGEVNRTRFGYEWHEDPASGTPLGQLIGQGPNAFDRSLSLAFGWLAEFQTGFKNDSVVREPCEVAKDLTVESFDLYPPSVPTDSFLSIDVPMHGDYFGSNIYFEDRNVTQVIDWEGVQEHEAPVGDAGYYLLQFADSLGDNFERGFKTTFIDDTRYRNIIRNAIHRYSDSIGISVFEFLTYLPYGYLTRIRQDIKYNYQLDTNWPDRVELIWNHHEKLLDIHS